MKNIVLVIGLLLCLCVSSWGACRSVPCGEWKGGASGCGVGGYCSRMMGVHCNCNNISAIYNNTTSGTLAVSQFGSVGGQNVKYCFTSGTIHMNNNVSSDPIYICDTQAEADSVQIAQKCTSGTVIDSTISGNKQFFCQNGDGLLFGFWDFSTNTHSYTIKYYIHTSTGYEGIDEGTYNHLAAQTCTEVSLYRGVLNGKYVYWYSTDPEPAGVVNVVRIK